jgi:hypothetical protein
MHVEIMRPYGNIVALDLRVMREVFQNALKKKRSALFYG